MCISPGRLDDSSRKFPVLDSCIAIPDTSFFENSQLIYGVMTIQLEFMGGLDDVSARRSQPYVALLSSDRASRVSGVHSLHSVLAFSPFQVH